MKSNRNNEQNHTENLFASFHPQKQESLLYHCSSHIIKGGGASCRRQAKVHSGAEVLFYKLHFTRRKKLCCIVEGKIGKKNYKLFSLEIVDIFVLTQQEIFYKINPQKLGLIISRDLEKILNNPIFER